MKKEILDELKKISPFLANKGKIKDGFKIPDNYFDALTHKVVTRTFSPSVSTEASTELAELSPLLATKGKILDGFKTPVNYFEAMSQSVFDKTLISKPQTKSSAEIQSISPALALMGKIPDGFKTPANYFDFMTHAVMQQIQLEQKPAKFQKSTGIVQKLQDWFANRHFGIPNAALAFASMLFIISALWLINKQPTQQNSITDRVQQTDSLSKGVLASIRDESDEDAIIENSLDKIIADEASKASEKSSKGVKEKANSDLIQSLKEEILEDEQIDAKI